MGILFRSGSYINNKLVLIFIISLNLYSLKLLMNIANQMDSKPFILLNK